MGAWHETRSLLEIVGNRQIVHTDVTRVLQTELFFFFYTLCRKSTFPLDHLD